MLKILYDNKKSIVFTSLVCVVAMFIFKDLTVSIVVAAVATSPYLIYVLRDTRNNNTFSFSNISFFTIVLYSSINLVIMALSIFPSYLLSEIVDTGVLLKFLMVVVYSLTYCLIAPYLYKTATSTYGHKYKFKYYVCTIFIIGFSELFIYSLNKLAAMYSAMALVAAPLVCLSYVLSLYLITIVNLLNNTEVESLKKHYGNNKR